MLYTTSTLVNPPSLSFSDGRSGELHSSQSIYLVNVGLHALPIVRLQIVGPNRTEFTESDSCVGQSIPSNNGCGIIVTFSPRGTGTRRATLVVIARARSSIPPISLSGQGLSGQSTP